MTQNKQGEFLVGGMGAVETYFPGHELSHLLAAYGTNKIPGVNSTYDISKSNFGDTAFVELGEKYWGLPNNDTIAGGISYTNPLDPLSHAHLDGGLGYAYAGSSNPYAQAAILAAGHAGVFGLAGLGAYISKKKDSFLGKIYSSVMSVAPTLNGVKDIIVGSAASDFFQLGAMTGLGATGLVGASALASAGLLNYIWGDDIKNWWKNRKEKEPEYIEDISDKEISKWLLGPKEIAG